MIFTSKKEKRIKKSKKSLIGTQTPKKRRFCFHIASLLRAFGRHIYTHVAIPRVRIMRWRFLVTLVIIINLYYFGNVPRNTKRPEMHLNVGIFITTIERPNGAFYLDKLITSLHSKGVPNDNILVYTPRKAHARLDAYMRDNPGVHLVERANCKVPLFKYVENGFQNLERLREARGDNDVRRSWRVSENKDFLSATKLALERFANYDQFLYLEDDMFVFDGVDLELELLKLGYLEHGIAWLSGDKFRRQWWSKAVLFDRSYLESFYGYLLLYYRSLPLDWLLEDFEDRIGHTFSDRLQVDLFDHGGNIRSIEL